MDQKPESAEWKSPDGVSIEGQIKQICDLSFSLRQISLVKVDLTFGLLSFGMRTKGVGRGIKVKAVGDFSSAKQSPQVSGVLLEEPMRFCIQQDPQSKHRHTYLELSLPGYNGLKIMKNQDFQYKIYHGFPRRIIIRRTVVKVEDLAANITLLTAEGNNVFHQYCEEPVKDKK